MTSSISARPGTHSRACRLSSPSGWRDGVLSIGDLAAKPWIESRAAGLGRGAQSLAQIHGQRLGLDFATCYDYLTRILSYDSGRTGNRRLGAVRRDGGAIGPGARRSQSCLPR